MKENMQFEFRKANNTDNLEQISELLYRTDPYIYPYWFGSLDNCKKELSVLLLEDGFFFNINNLYIMKDTINNLIVGVVCVVDKSIPMDYDYSELEKVNDRYRFTINNYVKSLIEEVQLADFAYISNVCVHQDYRGRHIGSMMVKQIIDMYRKKCFEEISLDVLADNPSAIRLYENLGFQQSSEIFDGFSDPSVDRPDVFSMKVKIREDKLVK